LEEREDDEKMSSGLTFGKLFARIRDTCNCLRIVLMADWYWRWWTAGSRVYM